MESFQYKIVYVEESNSTLASMCNNTRLNGSEFARYIKKILLKNNNKSKMIYLEVNIVEIILMIIYHH
jgi:hypothetical protein